MLVNQSDIINDKGDKTYIHINIRIPSEKVSRVNVQSSDSDIKKMWHLKTIAVTVSHMPGD